MSKYLFLNNTVVNLDHVVWVTQVTGDLTDGGRFVGLVELLNNRHVYLLREDALLLRDSLEGFHAAGRMPKWLEEI